MNLAEGGTAGRSLQIVAVWCDGATMPAKGHGLMTAAA